MPRRLALINRRRGALDVEAAFLRLGCRLIDRPISRVPQCEGPLRLVRTSHQPLPAVLAWRFTTLALRQTPSACDNAIT